MARYEDTKAEEWPAGVTDVLTPRILLGLGFMKYSTQSVTICEQFVQRLLFTLQHLLKLIFFGLCHTFVTPVPSHQVVAATPDQDEPP